MNNNLENSRFNKALNKYFADLDNQKSKIENTSEYRNFIIKTYDETKLILKLTTDSNGVLEKIKTESGKIDNLSKVDIDDVKNQIKEFYILKTLINNKVLLLINHFLDLRIDIHNINIDNLETALHKRSDELKSKNLSNDFDDIIDLKTCLLVQLNKSIYNTFSIDYIFNEFEIKTDFNQVNILKEIYSDNLNSINIDDCEFKIDIPEMISNSQLNELIKSLIMVDKYICTTNKSILLELNSYFKDEILKY